ncbi:uncharacterized protein LOC142786837 [Rhipicephalus microplus]|uniref:uncharacterized protein LOC142786837 n=1 Tax=Rhipicephalus microplus TaxID=6941 RepID=UPI003F6C8E54
MPGAHAFEGTVSSIDLRTSRSIQTMLDFFHKATEISEQDLLSGSMKPLPAFSQQLATISIPSTIILGQSQNETTEQAHSASGYNVYFALVTTNNYGSHSEVSNLASVNVPAHFTVPEGIALADAAVLVQEKVLKAKNESEGTDASLQLEKMTMSPWGELLSIPVSADADATPSAAPETSHAKTALKTKKATIFKKTTKPHNSASPMAKNKKRATSFTAATAKREKVVDHARAATAEEDSKLEPHSDLSTTPVNGSDADMNVTYPPPAEKKAVNKFDEEDDDGTLRAWILFAVFMIACLLICLNLAFLYCRAQFEVDDGPPGPGESVTSGYGSGF